MLTKLDPASHWLAGQIAGIHLFTLAGGLLIGVIEALTALEPSIQRYGSATAFVVAITALLWQQRKGIGLSRDNSHLE